MTSDNTSKSKPKKGRDLKKPPDTKIANRLKDLRGELTLIELAKKLNPYVSIILDDNVGRSAISNLENRKQNLTLELAIAYSKVFDVSLEYILCLSDDMQPENKSIKETIGLSDKSIDEIKKLKNNHDPYYYEHPDYKPPVLKILNTLYEEGFMTELTQAFEHFLFHVIVRNNLRYGQHHQIEDEESIMIPAKWHLNKEITDAIDDVIKPLMLELDDKYMGWENLP